MPTAAIGWGLAVLAIAIGYASWGWRGAVLGVTVAVFWLLLQFSRSLRALQRAARMPVGHVHSAVMLHAKLRTGMRLPEILQLTQSLGLHVAQEPDTWAWTDEGGVRVTAVLHKGRLASWQLLRETPPVSTRGPADDRGDNGSDDPASGVDP